MANDNVHDDACGVLVISQPLRVHPVRLTNAHQIAANLARYALRCAAKICSVAGCYLELL